MLQVFRDCCRRTYRTGGLPGMLWLWGLTFFDYLQSLIEEHLQRGVHMNKEKFIRLSGWALILSAFAWFLGWASSDIQEYNPYDALSRPVDRYMAFLYDYGYILTIFAVILIGIGVYGMYLRYNHNAGRLGRGGLVIAGLGTVFTLLVMVFSLILEVDIFWPVMMLSIILAFGGILVFGLAAIKSNFLPRWNYLPAFTGIWLPLLFLGSLITEPLTGGWLDIPLINLLGFGCTAVGLFCLGYLLQSDVRVAAQPAAG